jgi:uncharacterized protein (TIGR02001 family)
MLQWRAVQTMTLRRRKRAMKKMNLVPALVLSAAALPATSHAEVAAHIGWSSEYIYRGIFQEDSSAFAGIDYTSDGGFYLGTWGADVGQGIETDLYFGYAGGEDFTYKVGYTGYYYSDDFDDTYNEVNLGIGYGLFALDVAIGEWDGFGNSADYTFTSVTLAPDMWPYFKFGTYSDDFDGDYLEIGYTLTVGGDDGIDLTFALVNSDDLNVSDPDDLENLGDTQLTFSIKKTIGIGE